MSVLVGPERDNPKADREERLRHAIADVRTGTGFVVGDVLAGLVLERVRPEIGIALTREEIETLLLALDVLDAEAGSSDPALAARLKEALG